MAYETMTLRDLLKTDFELFDFDYNFDDYVTKLQIQQSIIDHYYTYEITGDTPDEFKHYFKTRFKRIMHYYNQLHNTTLLSYNPLINSKMTEAMQQLQESTNNSDSENKQTGEVATTGKANNINSATGLTTSNSDSIKDAIQSNDDSGGSTSTTSGTSNNESTTTASGSHEDTTESTTSGTANQTTSGNSTGADITFQDRDSLGVMLNGANSSFNFSGLGAGYGEKGNISENKSTSNDDTDSESLSNSDGTTKNTSNTLNNGVSDSETKTTNNNTSKSTLKDTATLENTTNITDESISNNTNESDTTSTTSQTGKLTNKANNESSYEKTVEGLTGITYQDLIKKERNNIINITSDIINELKPCFVLIY